MARSSAVSPEFEIMMMTSSRPIMPRSPWLASAGWTKMAGVPVEASVAAILRAIWPLLPMPVRMTRPVALLIRRIGLAEGGAEGPVQRGDQLRQRLALDFERAPRRGDPASQAFGVNFNDLCHGFL